MFIKRVSEFVNFLSLSDHEIEDLLSNMVHRVLIDLDATSIFISSLNSKNELELMGSFGMKDDDWQAHPDSLSVFAKYPVTDSLRTREAVWINTLPNWGKAYPLLKEAGYPRSEKTFVCIPIEKCGTPMAVMGIFCTPVIEPDAEKDSFIGALGNLLSLYLYRNIDAPAAHKEIPTISGGGARDQKLTERQMLILRMIAESRTNILISELLGYSESTIRQETIKIYAKLGCNGREEAARIYKDVLSKEDQ